MGGGGCRRGSPPHSACRDLSFPGVQWGWGVKGTARAPHLVTWPFGQRALTPGSAGCDVCISYRVPGNRFTGPAELLCLRGSVGTQDFPCTELTHQDLQAAQHRPAPATGQPASLQQEATWRQGAIPSLTNSTSAEQNAGLEAPSPNRHCCPSSSFLPRKRSLGPSGSCCTGQPTPHHRSPLVTRGGHGREAEAPPRAQHRSAKQRPAKATAFHPNHNTGGRCREARPTHPCAAGPGVSETPGLGRREPPTSQPPYLGPPVDWVGKALAPCYRGRLRPGPQSPTGGAMRWGSRSRVFLWAGLGGAPGTSAPPWAKASPSPAPYPSREPLSSRRDWLPGGDLLTACR